MSQSGRSIRLVAGVLLLCVLFVLLYVAATRYPLAAGQTLELSTAQFILLPFVFLTVLILRWRGAGIPWLAIGLAALGSLYSTVESFNLSTRTRNSFFISRLDSDQFEAESRVTRNRIRRYLGSGGAHIRSLSTQVHSWDEARAVAQREGNVSPLLWGNENWYRIYVPAQRATIIPAELQNRILQEYGLTLVPGYSYTGLPGNPTESSAQYVAALMSGVVADVPSRAESKLRTAALLNHAWRTYSHRSYAAFMLGNQYLVNAFSEGQLQTGELRCAQSAYAKAWSLMNPVDDPELAAAILNNHAVSLRLAPRGKQVKRTKRAIRMELRRAKHMVHLKPRYTNVFEGAIAARLNIAALRKSKGAGKNLSGRGRSGTVKNGLKKGKKKSSAAGGKKNKVSKDSVIKDSVTKKRGVPGAKRQRPTRAA